MANEFVARKGLIVSGSTQITGSLRATAGITGSLLGTSSVAISSSYAGTASLLLGSITSASYALTASYAMNGGGTAGFVGMTIDRYAFIANGSVSNFVVSQSYDPSSLFVILDGLTLLNNDDYTFNTSTNTVTLTSTPPSSSTVTVTALVNAVSSATGSFTGSFFGIISSASYAATAAYAVGASISGGTSNYIPQWTGTSTLSSSILYQTQSSILLGTSSYYTPSAPDALAVQQLNTASFNAITTRGTVNNYLQLNIQNLSGGNSASSDIVATANNGNETSGYVDMGINSNGYVNNGNGIGFANDAYLYTQGAGNLLIGNTAVDKKIILFTGGGDAVNNARIYIDETGSVGINTSTPTAGNPEALIVRALTNSYNLITAQASLDNYAQINIKNLSGGNSASSDLVATANNGTETSNYIDMGINSDQYNQPNVVGGPNDAYLYSTGNMLHIGNATAGQHIMLFAGGIDAVTNRKLQLNADNQHILSGSLNVTGSIRVTPGTINSLTASYASNAGLFNGFNSTVFATTGSNQFNGNQFATGSITALSGSITSSGPQNGIRAGGLVLFDDNGGSNYINGTSGQLRLVVNGGGGLNGNGVSWYPQNDNLLDVGTVGYSWKRAYINNMVSSGSITNTGSLSILSGSINIANGGVTSSLFGTSSFAVSSSFVTTASFATTASYALNAGGTSLKTKAGSIVNTSFTGNPRIAAVNFTTAFPNTNYAVVITGEDARTWTIQGKVAGGFTASANSNTALVGTTYWVATAYGEN